MQPYHVKFKWWQRVGAEGNTKHLMVVLVGKYNYDEDNWLPAMPQRDAVSKVERIYCLWGGGALCLSLTGGFPGMLSQSGIRI